MTAAVGPFSSTMLMRCNSSNASRTAAESWRLRSAIEPAAFPALGFVEDDPGDLDEQYEQAAGAAFG
jgi:hypothetical protein